MSYRNNGNDYWFKTTYYFPKVVSNALPVIVGSGKGNPVVPDGLPLLNDWRRKVIDTSNVALSKLQSIPIVKTFKLLWY